MSALLDQIELIVSKPPYERTEEEIHSIIHWFRKKSDVFTTLKTDAITDIIKNSELVKRPSDSLIIRQWDKGDCFFIILSGKVSIYIGIKDEEDNQVEEEATTEVGSRSVSLLQTSQATEDATSASDQADSTEQPTTKFKAKITSSEMFPKMAKPSARAKICLDTVVEAFQQTSTPAQTPLDRSKYGQYIASLEDGKSFGELALIRKDCIRNATIITDVPTRLLVVNRQLYNRCIKESQEKEFAAKMLFVKTSEYFTDWSARYKKLLAMSLKAVSYSYGMPLVCQGHPVDKLFFLISVLKSLHLRQALKPSLVHRRLRHARRSHAVKGYDICIIGEKNLIGDVELTTNLPTYLQSVVCEQQTEAFILDLRNYERLVTKRHAATTRHLFNDAMMKLSNRAFRFQQISFLRKLVEKHTSGRKPTVPTTPSLTPDETEIWNPRMIPSTNYGPLIDIHGKGTVFHYIRTRHQQVSKSKPKKTTPNVSLPDAVDDKETSTTVNLRNHENGEGANSNDQIRSGQRDESGTLSQTQSHQAGRAKLQEFELERMSRLELRMTAWCIDIETIKLKCATNASKCMTKARVGSIIEYPTSPSLKAFTPQQPAHLSLKMPRV